MMKSNKLEFSIYFSDESGPKCAIEYDSSKSASTEDSGGAILFRDYSDEARFSADNIDWIIECLQRIKKEINDVD